MSRTRQKLNAVLFGLAGGTGLFMVMGLPFQGNYTDPGVLAAFVAIVCVALFAGK